VATPAPSPAAPALIGAPQPRIDARAKVTGRARYPSDEPLADPAYGWLVTSAIAKGRITRIDAAETRSVPGVIGLYTHENASAIKPLKHFMEGGTGSTTIAPLASPRIWHDGQIVALVVAETLEAAREGAHRLRIDYAAETPSTSFDSAGTTSEKASDASKRHEDPKVGDADAAFAAAAVKVDGTYDTPTQHHNPMELFTTSCTWSGDRLTIFEPSQFVYGLKNGVAEQLGIPPAQVHVVSRYIGGAFGSKASVTPRTAIVAWAARDLRRPVKLVLPRQHGYTVPTYRAETRHHVRLGAGTDGRLAAYLHEGREVSSRPDHYFVGGNEDSSRMYAFGAVKTLATIVHADRNTPGFMRSPPETPYMYALEAAMDEMAVALKMDPIAYRLRNDTKTDPITRKPYSSRSLRECYEAAARAFGWERRDARIGAMRDGDWLVGWGCSTATYPSHIAPGSARVRLGADGRAQAQLAAHDVGTGTYTVAAQVVAERLGLEPAQVDVAMGDSDLPAMPVSGGSNVTASATAVLHKACDAIRARLFAAAVHAGPLAGQRPGVLDLRGGRIVAPGGKALPLDAAFKTLGSAAIEEYAEFVPPGETAEDVQKLYKGTSAITGGSGGDRMRFAFGAELVEVKVHVRTREIRVPRIVGAFAAGRIINARTARSQLMGGMIWGIGSALHEKTELDARLARYVNNDIAEYLVPVNADVEQLEVILVPETDHEVNAAGVKGLGELGNVATPAAVASAIHHATGRRVRRLPIRIEDLL
jgi:xanthine dehydrogenase YagR molybdenum-binding subunit